MIDVLVTGAAGKMGREVVKSVGAANDMRLVAAVDPRNAGRPIPDGANGEVVCVEDLSAAISSTRPHVMVDFTHPNAVEANIHTALAAGVDCVVGTTGLSVERLSALADDAPDGTCLFFAPNFAIGAVLMMRFAAEAARFLPNVEIIELHHNQKADAPSGTAMRTAALIAAARGELSDSLESSSDCDGNSEAASCARGALVDGVSVHSVRLPGLVAHQEVLFGGQGQTLSIRHDSIDRTSFMPGVLLAIREVRKRSGLIVGLEALM